jgi:hypothetical protein
MTDVRWQQDHEASIIRRIEGIDVTSTDLATLSGTNWVNDIVCCLYILPLPPLPHRSLVHHPRSPTKVINAYFKLLEQRSLQPGWTGPKVFAFSSFFYTKLVDGGPNAVIRWYRKVLLSGSLFGLTITSGRCAQPRSYPYPHP